MQPPDLVDVGGRRIPDRRHSPGRRDDDALSPEILLGYERWAGHIWRHRGKIAGAMSLVAAACGYAGGYLGRTHDLEAVRTDAVATKAEIAATRARLDSTIGVVRDLVVTARTQTVTVCSLTRRLDPAGTPPECGNYPPPQRTP